MNTFTKTLIASAMAVAVAGPAAASDLKEGDEFGAYKGAKTTTKITPSGCKNTKVKNVQSVIGFYEWDASTGDWDMDLSLFSNDAELSGTYIERKYGKDLTMGLDSSDLGDCNTGDGGQFCNGWVGVINDYLTGTENCGTMTDAQSDGFIIKKGNTKLSKNGDRAKVDLQIEGEYTDSKSKVKKVKSSIKGTMDFDSNEFNPAYD